MFFSADIGLQPQPLDPDPEKNEYGSETLVVGFLIRHFFSRSRRLLTKNFKSAETVNEKFECL